jgi:DNA (cytosine-5)-methyltransferase 1
MDELALFAGAGGGILGGHLLGWRTRCAVELDPYARKVLLARQRDGILPRFPIWDDIRTFEGGPWRGSVDVVSGGFPCQDISSAGQGRGLAGKRSSLWFEMLRVIEEVEPRFVFAENSPNLRSRGLGTIIKSLAELGYDSRWAVLGARHVYAPHRRDRMWILACNPNRYRKSTFPLNAGKAPRMSGLASNSDSESIQKHEQWPKKGRVDISQEGNPLLGADGSPQLLADSDGAQRERDKCSKRKQAKHPDLGGSSWWKVEPDVGRVAHGVASRMDRLKCTGNGQVPLVAAAAFEILRGMDW